MKNKARFEEIKMAAEFGKLIYSLIEILRFEHISDEISELMEENKIYCLEFTKLVYDHEKGQDYLRNLKLSEVMRKKELAEKYRDSRNEIEKIIEEWENVKSMQEVITKVALECEVKFKLENFRDKKFIVIPHENYKQIKDLINKNIKTLEDCVAEKGDFKCSKNILMKLQAFKTSLTELYDLVDNLETNQYNLEKQMLRANILQKNQDMFLKLKQAESIYKTIIDFVIDNPKVMELLKVKESIIDTNISLHKTLNEISSEQDDRRRHSVISDKNSNNANNKK